MCNRILLNEILTERKILATCKYATKLYFSEFFMSIGICAEINCRIRTNTTAAVLTYGAIKNKQPYSYIYIFMNLQENNETPNAF